MESFMKENSDESWEFFRQNYSLDQKLIHFSLAIHVPHSISLNKEIDQFRKMIDYNPDLMRRERHKYTNSTLEAAAHYLGTDKNLIALTDSSTMSLALIFNGFEFCKDDEILTTNSEHYSLEKVCESTARKNKLSIKKINLKTEQSKYEKKQIISNVINNISDKTAIVALSWVNSRYGIKLPLSEISKEIENLNRSRDENKKIILCVDGVHGFGVEYLESIHDLGVDFFAAGCHKWLFGPRGTGLLWGSERGWQKINPIIPSFEKIAWDHYLEWDNKKVTENDLIKSKMCTPGGFKSFEYIWALRHSFECQEKIGKKRIHDRVHYLCSLCKDELSKIPNIKIYTPLDPELSAGFICFNFEGIKPSDIVKKMSEHNIIMGQSPYKESCARLTPCTYNTEQEILFACNKLKEIAKELSYNARF
jgi:isopenicillin-N epimerase